MPSKFTAIPSMPLEIKLSLNCHQTLMFDPFNVILLNSAVTLMKVAVNPICKREGGLKTSFFSFFLISMSLGS